MIGLRKIESWVRNDMKSNPFRDNAKQKEEVKERADKVQSLAERKRVVKKKIFTQAVMPKTEGLGGVEQFNQKNQKSKIRSSR